jgi:hypothetical protein
MSWSAGRVDDTIAITGVYRSGAPEQKKVDAVVADSTPPDDGEVAETARSGGWIGRIGADWWAVAVVGVITVLAAADVLPKIPW